MIPPREELIRLSNVSKTYTLGDQKIHALKNISFSILKSDFITLLGPSGSGKSSFLNLVSLIDKPSQGTLQYKGIAVNDYSDAELSSFRNKKIGIIFQNYNLIPVLNVLENVAFPLQIQGVSKTEANERAAAILKDVGLEDRIDHRPANLSGGQRQRVAIARALVTNPEIVVADEPTAALDSRTGIEIINLMKELNQSKEITFIFSTHDQRIIKNVTNVIRLEDGCIHDIVLSDFEW